jgi:hypothetical protein
MMNEENDIDNLFKRIINSEVISLSSRWIEIGTEQKNPRLTLELACSYLLIYHELDKELVNFANLN